MIEAAAEAEKPARAPRVSRRRTRTRPEDAETAAEAPAAEAPKAEVAAEAAPAPETAKAEAPKAEEAKPARSRRGGRNNGRNRNEQRSEPAAETRPEQPQPRAEARGNGRNDQRGGRVQTSSQGGARRDRGGRVIGMGDHMPAFLAQEIDVQALIRASSRSDDKDEVASAGAPRPFSLRRPQYGRPT